MRAKTRGKGYKRKLIGQVIRAIAAQDPPGRFLVVFHDDNDAGPEMPVQRRYYLAHPGRSVDRTAQCLRETRSKCPKVSAEDELQLTRILKAIGLPVKPSIPTSDLTSSTATSDKKSRKRKAKKLHVEKVESVPSMENMLPTLPLPQAQKAPRILPPFLDSEPFAGAEDGLSARLSVCDSVDSLDEELAQLCGADNDFGPEFSDAAAASPTAFAPSDPMDPVAHQTICPSEARSLDEAMDTLPPALTVFSSGIFSGLHSGVPSTPPCPRHDHDTSRSPFRSPKTYMSPRSSGGLQLSGGHWQPSFSGNRVFLPADPRVEQESGSQSVESPAVLPPKLTSLLSDICLELKPFDAQELGRSAAFESAQHADARYLLRRAPESVQSRLKDATKGMCPDVMNTADIPDAANPTPACLTMFLNGTFANPAVRGPSIFGKISPTSIVDSLAAHGAGLNGLKSKLSLLHDDDDGSDNDGNGDEVGGEEETDCSTDPSKEPVCPAFECGMK
jgi:hypothetical protein